MTMLMRSLQDFETPRLVPLRRGLYAASFHLMKLLPARFMLEQAAQRGELSPGTTICESSSGTFGLALAMLATQQGYRLKLVSVWALDRHLHRRLRELGADVEIVKDPAPEGGLQRARLNVLAEYLAANKQTYWPAQYNNPDNPRAYGKFAAQLIDALGPIDCLVGPVGSGGSMSGTAKYLRVLFPEMIAIGVDTPNSVLFGQPSGRLDLSGLGGNILPGNVDHAQFDEIHWLTPGETFQATHDLHHGQGLFMGPTSGAAYRVADWWSRRNPGKTVVVIFPDEGHRYVETVYDADWLKSKVGDTRTPDEPILVASPALSMSSWSRYPWNRRSLVEVLAAGT